MRKQLLINGEWVAAQEYKELRSPYSGEVIAEVPVATTQEVDAAIAAAYAARGVMKQMPAYERAAILTRVSELLAARHEEAARILALEAAKPIATARIEVTRTVQTYQFAAEEAKRIYGETIPMDAQPGGESRLGYTVREPIGVVGAITPFNFPFNLVAHKLGPALAAGNTVVLKPASQTPLASYFIAELFMEAGLPAGALNLVPGAGGEVGDYIVQDDRVAMITFTGSPAVGIGIKSKAGLKRVTLELGSNAALIIDENVNVDQIMPRILTGAFSNQGQVCISVQRIYVHEQKFEEFVAKLAVAAGKLKLGDPLEDDTDLSALIAARETTRAKAWIDEAVAGGAHLVSGGTLENGFLVPTIFTDVERTQKISCQEVFAPVVFVNKVSSIDEAIAAVNDSSYGLQAGIYTRNLNVAMDAAQRLEVGGVMINDIPTYRVDHMPYGGVKRSGFGREGLKYAVEEMTEMKLVVVNPLRD
jgi:acyl-CoA reductase-like NAD-dependent aldehyde dehydrogenase